MTDTTPDWAIIPGMIVLIGLIILVLSLPFAFIGWLTLLVISIFTSVTITYFKSVLVGIAIFLLKAL